MNYTTNKTLTLYIIAVMTLFTFTYLFFLSISAVLIFKSLDTEPKTYIVVYKTETIKEVVHTPSVAKPQPKPVVKTATKPKVKATNTIDNNTYLLAQIINAEAKGEPYNGKVAVGNVILNRTKHPEFPDTIKGVIFQKGQFQPVSNGTIYNKPDSESLQAAKEVMNGKKVVGNQALYFYNPDIATNGWIFNRQTLIKIGSHRFAK